MQTYIALLRGINVGGRNKLPMKALRELLANIGLHAVKTYIQSGNVVFQSGETVKAGLESSISAAIEQGHGFRPAVMVLSLEDLEQAVAQNPYPEATDEPKTLHLYFLGKPAEAPDLERIESVKRESERFTLADTVFYLYAPEGIGRSKLAERVEKALGVPATARNWRSVSKILEMAKG